MIVHDEWNELKLCKQALDIRDGNDCGIHDLITMFFVHQKYVVEVIRKYTGQYKDESLDFRSRKEFDDLLKANFYFDQLVEDPFKR